MQKTPLNSTKKSDQLEVLDQTKNQIDNTLKTVQLNIQLNGAEAGIQFTEELANEFDIPFIVVNTNDRNHSTAEASVTIPKNLLNEPRIDAMHALSKTLKSRLSRNSRRIDVKENTTKIADSFFIKDGVNYIKILFSEIDFVKSDGNYIEIHWNGKKNILKRTLKSIEGRLPKNLFLQVHRSYLVNIEKLSMIGPNHLTINDHKIPLSKAKKDILLATLNTVI